MLASATSTDETRSGHAFDYPREVQFDVPVESNSYGGTGMFFTGTVGDAVHVTGWRTSLDEIRSHPFQRGQGGVNVQKKTESIHSTPLASINFHANVLYQ